MELASREGWGEGWGLDIDVVTILCPECGNEMPGVLVEDRASARLDAWMDIAWLIAADVVAAADVGNPDGVTLPSPTVIPADNAAVDDSGGGARCIPVPTPPLV
jgi:hypothetical protein